MSGIFAGLLAASGNAGDSYWSYTSLLLSTTSLNGAQNNTFLDSSSNNFTVTRNGNTTQGSFTPYGSNWSNYFDGNADWLRTTAINISSGDFTVEAWVYLNAMPTSDSWPGSYTNWMEVLGVGTASTADGWQFRIGQTVLAFGTNGDTTAVSATHNMVVGQWYHLAVTRSGNVYTLYKNGTSIGSATYTANNPGTGAYTWVGCETGEGAYLNGYISNARIVAGTAVYTANFTPPTAPLTAISGTSLLTCQSNRFIDNSSNNFTITKNGDVRVTPFSPYAPTAPYSAGANGGSMYFDGSGDYLSLPTAAGVIGTGDFTVEAWFKSNVSTAPTNCPIIANYEANSNGSWAVKASAGSNQCLSFAYYNSGWNDLNTSLNISSDLAWHHVAVTRSGTTLRIYADGVLINSWTVTASLGGNGYTLQIGRIANDDAYTNGFISDARLAVGTALYTGSTYTVPTAPLTAISGTKFLVGGRNAAIFDSAADNDLETVGNAQISTVQSKFGGSSVYFDGSGDYLTTASSPTLSVGSGDFTIEGWIYPTGVSGTDSVIFDFRSGNSANNGPLLIIGSGSNALVYVAAGAARITGSAVTLNTWSHFAVTRSGTSTRLFLNGTQTGSTYTDTNNYLNPARVWIGADDDGSPNAYFNGYIDDLRVTKGVARYTSNFTPPTAAFPTY